MNIDVLQIVTDIEREKKEANKFPVYALYGEILTVVGGLIAAELNNLVVEGKLVMSETLNSHAFGLKQ